MLPQSMHAYIYVHMYVWTYVKGVFYMKNIWRGKTQNKSLARFQKCSLK